MAARTRVDAADAVVTVTAEGVDQATARVREVQTAVSKIPDAVEKTKKATEASSKAWGEWGGKIGAAIGTVTAIQGLALDTKEGMLGLAGAAAAATAALGPWGVAVTLVGAGINRLRAHLAESRPDVDLFLGQMDAVAKAAQDAAARIDGLAKATGGYLSTLSQREKNQLAEAQAAVEGYAAQAREIQAQIDQGWTREKELAQEAADAGRRWADITVKRLTKVSEERAKAAGLIDLEAVTVKAATSEWSKFVDALNATSAASDSLLADLERGQAEREAEAQADLDRMVAGMAAWQAFEESKRDEARKTAEAEKRNIRETQEAFADFFEWKAEQRQLDLDRAMSINAAALSAAVGVAGAFGATEATINTIKGLSASADALLYGAKAYAAFASFNPWSGAQYTLAAIGSAAAAAAYFQAAGSGGAAAPAVPSGGAASVSAPPSGGTQSEQAPQTVNISFDRLARPLTRGDERAVRQGLAAAMGAAGGGRGLGSRRQAS